MAMLYPQNIEEKLGFNIIRNWLQDFCTSEAGVEQVNRIQFSSEFIRIGKLLGQTMEMKSLLELGNFPAARSLDSVNHLDKCKLEGSYLELEELQDVSVALDSTINIWEFLLEKKEETGQLNGLLHLLFFNKDIPKKIRAIFNEKGEVKDDASPALKKIRKDLKDAQSNLHRSLNKVFNQSKRSGYVPENMTPTIRDGRLVIPVLAEYKRRLPGFIHDESSTGQTVYIEPSEALESNNAIIELQYAERREIIRILTGLSELLRLDLNAVRSAFRFLSLIEMIQAKARLAIELDAFQPEILDSPGLELINARHPVLYRNYRNSDKTIVPLNIKLNTKNRILLVSGPNAGGKSVCLKTTGLIQYMMQCGIPVPVHPDSRLGIYKQIFVDIGDEQSIENDLSTYSSHLKNMNVILKKSDDKTLILIDEFGTGTDPQFGGAIAEAILDSLKETLCQGVITTHYGNLKEFAQNNPGVINGAMQFDMENLEPLYSLETGRPGSSFALEVASKIGLGSTVLKKARKLIGTDTISMEALLNKLSHEKNLISKKLAEIDRKEAELSNKIKHYTELQEVVDSKKREIIESAKNEANELLNRTNREIEKTIRHIKENKAQKQETIKIRSNLEEFKKNIKPQKKKRKAEQVILIPGPILVGDNVLVEDSGVVGEVMYLRGKSANISVGGLLMKTSVAKLKKIKGDNIKKKKVHSTTRGLDISKKQSNFSPKLDIRGKRAEEATNLLEAYIDDALLLGHHELKILHGKGDGILREVVRNYLRQFAQVVSVKDEHIDRGGDGITIVNLK